MSTLIVAQVLVKKLVGEVTIVGCNIVLQRRKPIKCPLDLSLSYITGIL